MAKDLKTWGAARESEWLAAEDIDGMGDVLIRITAVKGPETIKINGKTKPGAVWAEFVHAQTGRPLFNQRDRFTVSGERRKMLRKLFGPDPQAAVGKVVALYCVDTVWAGEACRGFRIRPELPEPPKRNGGASEPAQDLPLEPEREEQPVGQREPGDESDEVNPFDLNQK